MRALRLPSPPKPIVSRARLTAGLLAAGIMLSALLTACTGTFETRPPVLLVVAFGDELALIEDTFLTADEVAERLLFLSASRRTLPAPAVDFDVIARATSRRELMVLARAETAPFTATLLRFDLRDIDPADPVAFSELSRLDLSALLESAIGPDDYCLTRLQVSGNGRYLALLDDRDSCSPGQTFTAIYVVDLTNDSLVVAINTEPVVAAGIYLDQANDTLYYLAGVGSAELRSRALPSGSRNDLATVSGDDQVDLGPVQQFLLALRPNGFQAVDLDAAPPSVGDPVASHSGSERLITDPQRGNPELLTLGGGSASLYAAVTDTEPERIFTSAVSGTFEPGDKFAYLLEPGAINVVDLLALAGGGQLSRRITIGELPTSATELGPITWARAVTAP